MNYSKQQIRIMTDIINFKKQNFQDIFINVDKQNINNIKAMILGPKNTPYQNGFFFFDINFPNDYPTSNPTVQFRTTDNKVRFNPNLYSNGKVCLSILGTWNGPGWQPTMNLTSVLLSIQSLLHENPIINEPGYEKIKIQYEKSQIYNKYLIYHTYRLAFYDVLKGRRFKIWRELFKDEINNIINKNLDEIKNEVQSYSYLLDGLTLPKIIYFMESTNIEFTSLKDKVLKLKNNI